MNMSNHFPWTEAEVLVLGCGNTLYGDDGFGPEVAENLKSKYSIPDGVLVMDVGSSVRELLFDVLLSAKGPGRIIIVDIVDHGKIPGEVFELGLENIPPNRRDDFSIHQVPTSNLLRELQDYKGIDIRVIGAQAAEIPPEVKPGLSTAMKSAVDVAVELIAKKYFLL